MKKLITLIPFILFAVIGSSQGTTIKVKNWNAVVHLPKNYNPSIKYSTILFSPGLGEIGTDVNKLISNGPSAYIKQGWDGGNFIVISLQPPTAWPSAASVKIRVDELRKLYPIGNLYMTGLSMGGNVSLGYSYSYPSEVKAVVGVESVVPSEGTGTDYEGRIHDTYKAPALAGQKYLLFEQKNDWRRNDQVITAMNFWSAGSGTYVNTAFGGGGHCCWNEFYGGQGKQPGRFAEINNKNLYEWIADQDAAPITPPPVPSNKMILLGQGVADTSIYFTNSKGEVKPGDTLSFVARYYAKITLLNLKGTAEKPIIINNYGGQVEIAGSSYGGLLNIKNSEYFRFTGTGDTGTQYGFYIHGPSTGFTSMTGANTGDGTRYYSFDNIEVEGTSIGFYCKVYPGDFDSLTWAPYWNQGNVSFSYNLVRRINGEAFYVGHNDAVDSVLTKDKNGKVIKIGVEPPLFDTVTFSHNITDSTQWDGIQVSGAQPMIAHDNTVTNFGLANVDGQRQGIIMGARSWGSVYNNRVENGKGIGIVATPYSGPSGEEKSLFYNNIISGAQEFGMYFSDNTMKDGAYTGANIYVFNNTIINSGTKAGSNVIKVANNGGTMNSFEMKNNLIAGYTRTPVVINPITHVDTSKNHLFNTVGEAKLVPGIYKLSPSSSIFDVKGADLSQYFQTDFSGEKRMGVYGIGAYKTFDPGVLPVIIREFEVYKGKRKL